MKLPFIISIPHCSSNVPEEVRPLMGIEDREIIESADSGTLEIFGSLPAEVVIISQWSRLAVDLNRAGGQRGAKGVVPHLDYYGRVVYKTNSFPSEGKIKSLVDAYYNPYHRSIEEALSQPEIRALFDCHSLNGTGPVEAPDAGEKRKDIILGNNGDPDGNPDQDRGQVTSPPETLHIIEEVFRGASFSVSVNQPYAGGYITTHYGRSYSGKGKIAVQIEINQDLFLKSGSDEIDPEKLARTKSRVFQVFEEIAGLL